MSIELIEDTKEYDIQPRQDIASLVRDAIDASCFSWVSPEIWRFERSEPCDKVVLSRLSYGMTNEQVLRCMDVSGYRPANLEELLSFVVNHDFRDGTLVALGSMLVDDGGWTHVPCVGKPLYHDRGLGTFRLEFGPWLPYVKFVAVPK